MVEAPLPSLMNLDFGLEAWDEKGFQQAKANEPLELLDLDHEQHDAMVRIRTKMSSHMWRALKDLLIKYMDVFIWSYEDMPRIETPLLSTTSV